MGFEERIREHLERKGETISITCIDFERLNKRSKQWLGIKRLAEAIRGFRHRRPDRPPL